MINSFRLTFRSDTSDNWKKYNPILRIGEFGNDVTNKVLKIGDGVTSWNNLFVIMEVQK